jgi:hypothetical protein
VHYLPHQLLDHLLADEASLLASTTLADFERREIPKSVFL